MINCDYKWVKQILDLQHEDGSWGCFHSLSNPTKEHSITTEQALRRLYVLGLTKGDEPIKRAIAYMEWCLVQPVSPVFHEKKHLRYANIFSDLMLSANIRRFDRVNAPALTVAQKWADILEVAFAGGTYNHLQYVQAYEKILDSKLNHKDGFLVNFSCFYHLAMLPGILSARAESGLFDYVLNNPTGVGYMTEKPVAILPENFASKKTSYWLAVIELLANYRLAPEKLGFVVNYLLQNQLSPGVWDLGAKANDGIYFPLSDSWRKVEDRQRDCSVRIQKLLDKLTASDIPVYGEVIRRMGLPHNQT
jgi:hypothetical protein